MLCTVFIYDANDKRISAAMWRTLEIVRKKREIIGKCSKLQYHKNMLLARVLRRFV